MLIEKNIPINSGSAIGKTRDCQTIVDQFEIGDSALIPSNEQTTYRVIVDRIVRSQKETKKFSFKKWDEKNYRVWRVA